MDEEKEALKATIRDALRMIVDPEIGGSLVDLGLIYDIAVEEGGIARITMTTTTRGCPASSFLTEAVEHCVSAVAGIEHAHVRLTYEPPWTPQMMVET
ncbi:aromatic ring hydroxylase [Rhizobium sp. Root73]|uniref:metal-sulfur cluster assembly factor n=1 Tax=unclassified Rhizobium TaxID=2613769 RepID=UPI0007281692|nr:MULTISPECIES: metal-sulfur cluster assembly factor [unclassified Rhizobium]KQY16692.1 aromatic ring hydroxylase [Rhizobium sp. Root1334]KRC11259.1 aromatic ring hydroxylase [Rhizobium sp. Root73]